MGGHDPELWNREWKKSRVRQCTFSSRLRGNSSLGKIQHREKTKMKTSSSGFLEICRPQFLAIISTWCSKKTRQRTSIKTLYLSNEAKDQKNPMMIDSFLIVLSNWKRSGFLVSVTLRKRYKTVQKSATEKNVKEVCDWYCTCACEI